MARSFLPALLVAVLVSLSPIRAQGTGHSLGLEIAIVADADAPGRFPCVASGVAAPLWHDAADHAGVLHAIGDLRADIDRVASLAPTLGTAPLASSPSAPLSSSALSAAARLSMPSDNLPAHPPPSRS